MAEHVNNRGYQHRILDTNLQNSNEFYSGDFTIFLILNFLIICILIVQ